MAKMPSKLSIEGDKRIMKSLAKMDKGMMIALQRGIRRGTIYVEDRVKRALGGQILNVRSGDLRSSITHDIRRTGKNVIGRVGTNLEYARIHEYGGTIVPKVAKFLTIPFPGIVGRAREFANTFFAKGVLFQKLGGGDYRPLFVLKESVRIPERSYLRSTLKRNRRRILDLIYVEIARHTRKA